MLNKLKEVLKYLQDNDLPCHEVKLAIYLVENK